MICVLIVLGIMAWGLRHLGKHEQQFVRMMVISIIFLLLPLAIGLDFMQPVEVVQDSLLRLLPIPLVVLPIACIYSLFRTRLLGATSIFSRQVMRVLLWILLSSVFVFGAIILLRTLLLAGLSQDKLNYIYALLLVCSLFLFPLVWSKVRDVGDQVLYGDFYEYNRSLRELSAALTRLQSFEQISTFMLPRLSTLLNATEAAILLRPGELTGVLLDSGGRETLSGWRIYRHCETHSKYADQIVRTPFSEERLLRVANLALTHLREAVDEPLLLDGVLLLALYHGNRCSGFLCLGPKFNLEPYNKQDRSFLSTLASQLSVLEVNSRYLEQAQTDAQQLAALNHRVMSAQEEERRHLALELHDDALQQAMLVVRELSDAGTMADVAEVMPLARSVVASLRRTCLELRPPLLEELGLVEAFQWLVRQTVERGGNHLPVQIICRGSWSNRPSADVELAFYRVGQEALSNILKYAGASRVMLRLDQRANGQLSLLVIDNGRGLQPRPRRRAENLGLIGMQERMAAIGGQLQIRTSPGRGVIIRATYCQSNADSVQPAYALTSVAASAIGQEAHR
jgi:signal transduction histidine kinase